MRCSEYFEDFEDLINFRVTHEKRSFLKHLSEDAPRGPEVDSERVVLRREQDLRTAVPECDNLMGVSLDREAESSG